MGSVDFTPRIQPYIPNLREKEAQLQIPFPKTKLIYLELLNKRRMDKELN